MLRLAAATMAVVIFAFSTWLNFAAFREPLRPGPAPGFHEAVAVLGYFGIVLAGVLALVFYARPDAPALALRLGGACGVAMAIIATSLHLAVWIPALLVVVISAAAIAVRARPSAGDELKC